MVKRPKKKMNRVTRRKSKRELVEIREGENEISTEIIGLSEGCNTRSPEGCILHWGSFDSGSKAWLKHHHH